MMTQPYKDQDTLLLEVGWEVCNKLGGIYTVLRSKAPAQVHRWGDQSFLVGPLNKQQADIEFEEAIPTGPVGAAILALREQGIHAVMGHWLVSGHPRVVLIDLESLRWRLPEIRERFARDCHVTIDSDEPLVHDVVAFSEGVRLLMHHISANHAGKVVAHFHEWMAGAAIPCLRRDNWSGTCVFTTHATILGRYLAMNSPHFYDSLPAYRPEAEAEYFNITCQHQLERAAAHGAQVFTTVSEVTALECRYLLGRDPDVLLPNGMALYRFTALHEFQNLHKESKEKIHRFTMAHFFPSYSFDLDKTLYFFSSGRYEYHNKGMDLTLESLARLNWRLKEEGSDATVVFFLVTRRPVNGMSVGALQSNSMLRELDVIAEKVAQDVRHGVLQQLAMGYEDIDLHALLGETWEMRLRRAQHAWRRPWLPPVVTHDVSDDHNDDVLNKIRSCGLFNGPDDRVKVIYHPDFISSTNPLFFGMEYDDFVRGCHLGVFPSYYEPWGYTPLEAIAMGVPATTSDLAGFGQYAATLRDSSLEKVGLYVTHRRNRCFNESCEELTEQLLRFCVQTRRQRIAQRNRAESFSQNFDWEQLYKHYDEAHALALDRI